jgi:glycosyltransferase involved in cell wall biosynthesis
MRILHIVGSISPAAGGPTEAIRMLIEHAPPGYTSEVVTLNDPSEPFLATFPFKITALGSAKKSWYVPALTRWLRSNRDRFDGIMLHGLWEYTGVAVLRAIAGHKPYVVFPHGMLDLYFKKAFPAKHAKKWLFWHLFQNRILRNATRVLFTTTIEENLAQQSFKNWKWDPLVVALGAESPPHDPAISIPAFYKKCPAVEGHPFLLFLGRIDPKKGCDLLLEAFASVNNPNLHLVIAGPDANNWRAELEVFAERNGIAARVHWPGMLQGEAKWGAFAASEAFILPSHQENFGIAVVEALACGRPVLLSGEINIALDVVEDGCGFMSFDTVEGTKALLINWLHLPTEARATMSQQALRTFATRYDMRHNTELILRVFEPTSNPHQEAR